MISTNFLVLGVRQEESCHSLEEIISILQRVQEILKAYVIRTNFFYFRSETGRIMPHSLEEIIRILQRVQKLL